MEARLPPPRMRAFPDPHRLCLIPAGRQAAFALAAGCHSITFSPGYQSCVEAPKHAGGEVTVLELKAAAGWQIDLQQVKAAIRANTRYIVINQPYNPAGTLMSRETQVHTPHTHPPNAPACGTEREWHARRGHRKASR